MLLAQRTHAIYLLISQDGRVCIDATRTLHTQAMDEFNVPNNTRREVYELLDECESMLNGVRLIQELSPKSLDQLVSLLFQQIFVERGYCTRN